MSDVPAPDNAREADQRLREAGEAMAADPWEESSDGRYCKWCGCAAPGHHYYVHGTQHAASCPVARFRHAARARAVLAP